MIRFKAKTEEQVSRLLNRGKYPCKLLELKPVKSKDGSKDMAFIRIEAVGTDKKAEVIDRIPFTEKMAYKWRHFCHSFGLIEMYQSEIFTGMPAGEHWGQANIDIEQDPTGTYTPKNKVVDYIVNQDIPF